MYIYIYVMIDDCLELYKIKGGGDSFLLQNIKNAIKFISSIILLSLGGRDPLSHLVVGAGEGMDGLILIKITYKPPISICIMYGDGMVVRMVPYHTIIRTTL